MKCWLVFSLIVFGTVGCGDNVKAKSVTGEACSTENDCETGLLCVKEFADGVNVAEGLCTQTCAWTPDDETSEDTCPEEKSTLDEQLCLRYNFTEEFFCFISCEYDEDCRVEDHWSCECVNLACSEQACIPPL